MIRITATPRIFQEKINLATFSQNIAFVIVRMSDNQGTIRKMFSWRLLKGTNVASISGLENFEPGIYHLDVLDGEGNTLQIIPLTKTVDP